MGNWDVGCRIVYGSRRMIERRTHSLSLPQLLKCHILSPQITHSSRIPGASTSFRRDIDKLKQRMCVPNLMPL
jgi:hypothetical protein